MSDTSRPNDAWRRRYIAAFALAAFVSNTLPNLAHAKPKKPLTCTEKRDACYKRCIDNNIEDVKAIIACEHRTCDHQKKACDEAAKKPSKATQHSQGIVVTPDKAQPGDNPLTDQNRAPKQPGILDNTPGLPPPAPGAIGTAGPHITPTTNAPVTGGPSATGAPHVRVPPAAGGSINAPSTSPRTPPPIIR